MNKRLVIRTLSALLLLEAACMIPAFLIGLYYHDGDALSLFFSALITGGVGLPAWILVKPEHYDLRAKEGFLIVSLGWILLSAFGALPFVFSGLLSNYVDAFFEATSGFTTTGASVFSSVQFEKNLHGIMFWRSFTHWIGGMGVLVLSLALLPKLTGRTSHLVRAESPGPSLSKIAPKMSDSAKILYIVYASMTAVLFLLLVIAGMQPYDAAIHSFGTAGTGGFSNYPTSVAAFQSPAIDVIITIFMLLFGINLALIYGLFVGRQKEFFRSEELRWYLGIVSISVLFLSFVLLPSYHGDYLSSLRYASFQVASIISTTGYATADFNLWPIAARMLIILLMFIGSCAGSTAGGMKVVRVALLIKQGKREITRTYSPRRVQVVRFEGRGIDEHMLHQVAVFAFVYFALILAGSFLVSLTGKFDFETNITSALTCVSNVGPGLGAVGPSGGFSAYGSFEKIVLSLLMLAGRLELFPILVLFTPGVWKKV